MGDPTFSSFLNSRPRSEINLTTDTKRCRQWRFPMSFAFIDLTVQLCICSSLHLRLNVIVKSLCSTDCSRLLRRSKPCCQSKIPLLVRKCAHLVVSSYISLQVRHLTHVCEGEKQSQFLSTTSQLCFRRRIGLVVHFCDMFLSFLCCSTTCFKNEFSSQSQKKLVSHFNQYSRIYAGILAGQRAQRPISLPPVKTSAISSMLYFSIIHLDLLLRLHCWLNEVYIHRYVDLSLSQHVLRFSVLLQVPQKCLC